ncbi:MAG TPA: hypothetical protein VGL12_00400 [Roseiarcus sp.]
MPYRKSSATFSRPTNPTRKKSELGPPPARGFAILTCMDARLDPAKYTGLAESGAHVIRNDRAA